MASVFLCFCLLEFVYIGFLITNFIVLKYLSSFFNLIHFEEYRNVMYYKSCWTRVVWRGYFINFIKLKWTGYIRSIIFLIFSEGYTLIYNDVGHVHLTVIHCGSFDGLNFVEGKDILKYIYDIMWFVCARVLYILWIICLKSVFINFTLILIVIKKKSLLEQKGGGVENLSQLQVLNTWRN